MQQEDEADVWFVIVPEEVYVNCPMLERAETSTSTITHSDNGPRGQGTSKATRALSLDQPRDDALPVRPGLKEPTEGPATEAAGRGANPPPALVLALPGR
jgi:hypothetical protein